MEDMAKTYESYPTHITWLAGAVSFVTYALGAHLLLGLHPAFAVLYLSYTAIVEVSVMRKSCRHCFYYGKSCGIGKGKLCALLFRQGTPGHFIDRQVTWRDVIPDTLVLILPVVGGVVRLIGDFGWLPLVELLTLMLLATAGAGFIRGSLACKHCRQRELGCPAAQLFGGDATSDA